MIGVDEVDPDAAVRTLMSSIVVDAVFLMLPGSLANVLMSWEKAVMEKDWKKAGASVGVFRKSLNRMTTTRTDTSLEEMLSSGKVRRGPLGYARIT